jgi:hypothetical protein
MTLYSVSNPYPVILALDGQGLNGGAVYIGTAGMDPQTNPIPVYWDEAGTDPASQPLATIGGYITRAGTPAEAYVSSATYSIRVRDRFGSQVFYDPSASSGLSDFITSLASTDPGKGASLVGNENGGTVQDALDVFEVENLGVLPAGSSHAIDFEKTGSANASGSTQFYSLINRAYLTGSNNCDFFRAQYSGTHINTTGGTTAQADGIHAYVWQNGAGSISNVQVVAAHVRLDGPGDITGEAINYRATPLTLGGVSGTITTTKGFSAGQLGHATRVTNVYAFEAEDQSASSVVIGFRSAISAGTNKYQFFGAGTAASALGGSLGVGMTSTPTWKLHVQEATATHIAAFDNTNAAGPTGVRIRYTAAAPNDSDHAFLTCSDSVGDKLIIWASGSVVNATNSYGAISDKRLKTAIRDSGSQLSDIMKIRIRKYRLKADGDDAREQLGVVAQEVEKVSPGLVAMGKDGFRSVNYSILYLKAVKALQEAITLINDLHARVAKLEDAA